MQLMIVDDSELLQNRLKKALMEAIKNLNILQAFNCKEAMVMFSSFKPEAVVLDIDLPDGSGIDLLRKFKKENSGVKVIMFTNYPTNEFKRSCMELGANEFIEKSNLNELINAIRNYTKHHYV
jgi:DNA-binding response OmpR family regulator